MKKVILAIQSSSCYSTTTMDIKLKSINNKNDDEQQTRVAHIRSTNRRRCRRHRCCSKRNNNTKNNYPFVYFFVRFRIRIASHESILSSEYIFFFETTITTTIIIILLFSVTIFYSFQFLFFEKTSRQILLKYYSRILKPSGNTKK